MRPILETVIFVVGCATPVSMMGFSAFLIYKQANGWGWYLIATVLVVGSMRIKFDGFGA
jgi:hypothetical protein